MEDNQIMIKKFLKERNEALLSLDKNKITKTFKKHGVKIPEDEQIFWAGVHKARMEVSSFTEDVKKISRDWLILNGFYPGIGSAVNN